MATTATSYHLYDEPDSLVECNSRLQEALTLSIEENRSLRQTVRQLARENERLRAAPATRATHGDRTARVRAMLQASRNP